jgi:hypothetical protein
MPLDRRFEAMISHLTDAILHWLGLHESANCWNSILFYSSNYIIEPMQKNDENGK